MTTRACSRRCNLILMGTQPRFEEEHRCVHQDRGWRWVLARAAAVRHASGRAYRVVGLNLDISARRQAQEVLVELADGMHGLQGEDAYTTLVRKFVSILDMQEAFLCECCDDPPTRVRMLLTGKEASSAPCSEFDLAGTPCCEVIVSAKPVFAGAERVSAGRQRGATASTAIWGCLLRHQRQCHRPSRLYRSQADASESCRTMRCSDCLRCAQAWRWSAGSWSDCATRSTSMPPAPLYQ
jgi:hypothetical protein